MGVWETRMLREMWQAEAWITRFQRGSKAVSEARLEAIWVYILSKDLTFLCWCPESLGEAKF